jgi:ligand-binding sensor domain-containing protein
MNRRARIAIAAGCVVILAWAGSALWRASRAIGVAEREIASTGHFPFVLSELHAVTTGMEQISAPAQFSDATVYKGRIYAAGPGGLFTEGIDYRVGALLPPAPLSSMAQAITSQSAEPELWIGTSGEGMLAFDGMRFRHLRPVDARARNVTAVVGLGVGRVLFGTQKAGLLAYDGKNLTRLHDSLSDLHVTCLAGDETDLWVGTIDRGLLHWRAGQVTEIRNLPDQQVLSIATGQDGSVYVGTALGIAVIKGGRVERTIGPGLFAKILFVRGQQLYAGTLDPGMQEVPLTNTGRPHFIETPSPVHKIFESDETLLAVSDEGVFAARQWLPALKPAKAVLADRNISTLSVDNSGQLWVGYFDRGLDVVDSTFSRARHFEDQHLFCVNRIVHGPTTAVATANGLVLFDRSGEKRQVLGRDQGLLANHVTDIVWNGSDIIAATPAGLSLLSADGVRSLYAFHGLANNHVYALSAEHGRILAGTLGGLSLVEDGLVRVSYTTSNSPLRHNWITAIASSGHDTYIGTYGAGVIKLGPDATWQSFSDIPPHTEINPGAMAATPTHVYAGTLGKGVLVYDSADHRWHALTQGLPSLNVTAVHVANGRVYVGTDNGVVRLP